MENMQYCQRVARELEAYAEGRAYRCPECDEVLELPESVGDKFCCPRCKAVWEVEDAEQLSVYDWISDALDISYVVQSDRRTLDGVKVWVTLGGPSVWVDTCSRTVELRWGGKSASCDIWPATCDALDDAAQELWDC